MVPLAVAVEDRVLYGSVKLNYVRFLQAEHLFCKGVEYRLFDLFRVKLLPPAAQHQL